LALAWLAALLVLPAADERPVARVERAARARVRALLVQQAWERAASLPLLGRVQQALPVRGLPCAPVLVQDDLA
jgi:hypothetical protein